MVCVLDQWINFLNNTYTYVATVTALPFLPRKIGQKIVYLKANRSSRCWRTVQVRGVTNVAINSSDVFLMKRLESISWCKKKRKSVGKSTQTRSFSFTRILKIGKHLLIQAWLFCLHQLLYIPIRILLPTRRYGRLGFQLW